MKIRLTLLCLLLASFCFGQNFVFDTTKNNEHINSSKYYSKTDFTLIDTLSLWNYYLDTTYHGRTTDSVKPIGLLTFWRTKPIDDSVRKQVYGRLWTPSIEFEVYNMSDSSYCYYKSFRTRVSSSCVAPDVGGDIIMLDNFLFLSRWVCLNCQRYDKQVDYCRPVINYVFSSLNKAKITTIQNLVQRFAISKGQLPKED